MNSNESDVMFH